MVPRAAKSTVDKQIEMLQVELRDRLESWSILLLQGGILYLLTAALCALALFLSMRMLLLALPVWALAVVWDIKKDNVKKDINELQDSIRVLWQSKK